MQAITPSQCQPASSTGVRSRVENRKAQVREAEEIYEWVVSRKELADDLIWATAKVIKDRREAETARFDLSMIATRLAPLSNSSKHPVWKTYQQHFIGDRQRRRFFANLRRVTR